MLAACGSLNGSPSAEATGEQRAAMSPISDAGIDAGVIVGGPIASPHVVVVFWDSPGANGGASNPVNPDIVAAMPKLYSAMLSSGYVDWLQEYNAGVAQFAKPRGDVVSAVHITPSFGVGQSVTVAQVGAELAAQINNNILPVPNPDGNMVYMVSLPNGLDWGLSDTGKRTCQKQLGGLFGWHRSSTQQVNGADTILTYALVSDLTGCISGLLVDNETQMASHLLAETMTNPQSQLNQSEIGDVCLGRSGSIQHFNGTTNDSYKVQPLWSTENLACALDGTPRSLAAISPDNSKLQVIYRSSDVNLHTLAWDGSAWNADASIGGPVDSAAAVVKVGSGTNLAAFIRGTNGRLYKSTWNGNWTGFVAAIPPQTFTDTPTAVTRDATHTDVFIRGTDGQLYTLGDSSPAGWSNYFKVIPGDHPIVGSPVPISRDSAHIDVFLRGTDNGLYYVSFHDGAWDGTIHQPQSGANQLTGSPAVVSWGANREDVFARGTAGALQWWAFDGMWHSAVQIQAQRIAGSPMAVSMAPNSIDVFVHGIDKSLYWTSSTNAQNNANATWAQYSHGVVNGSGGWGTMQILGNPAALSRVNNSIDLFAQDTGARINTASWNGTSWTAFTSRGGSLY